MLDPRRLKALRAVAAHGSIAGAATALGYTPSAVSQSVAAMERYLDLQLMERTSRGVTLTPAGVRLVEHADVILAHLDAAEREARANKGPGDGSPLTLGTLAGAGALAARAAVELLRERPATDLRIVDTDAAHGLAMLRDGEVDVTLAHVYDGVAVERPRWVHHTPLYREPAVAVLPHGHPVAASRAVALADLAGERFIGEARPEHRGFTAAACAAAGFTPELAARSSDHDVTLALVANGLGVALVPRDAAHATPGVVVRPLSGDAAGRELHAATRVGTARIPGVAALLGALRRASSGERRRGRAPPPRSPVPG